MRIVHLAYSINRRYNDPEVWLDRIDFFTGILDAMTAYSEVFHINFIDYEGSLRRNNVVHYFFKMNGPGKWFPFSVHSFVRSLKPDVVMVHGLIFPMQVLLLRLQSGGRIKIVAQNHAEKPLKGPKKYLQRLADRYIEKYFFTSADLARPWVRAGQIRHIEKVQEVMEVSSRFYPVDKETALSCTGISEGTNYLWVGRLDPNKDPALVVNSFLDFLKQGAQAHLYIIFQVDTLLPKLQEIINRHQPWSGAIHLVGKIPHEELIYWYNSVDFIISSSHYEGSGVAVCEAMSCGCIPVLTDIPSFRMMTQQGACGMLYEAGNKESLLLALMKTVGMDRAAERAGVLNTFKTRLSFEAIAKQIYDTVSSL